MTERRIAARPDDLIDYGRYMWSISGDGPTGGDTGLAPIIDLLQPLSIPIPDEQVIPGGAAFAGGLNENIRQLIRALEEIAAGYLTLGEGVEHIGHSSRDAEEARTAQVKALGPKLPRTGRADAPPLGTPAPGNADT